MAANRWGAAVIRSEDDVQGQLEVLKNDDTIALQQGERHRLVGLEDWVLLLKYGNILMRKIHLMSMILFEFKMILGVRY